MVVRAIRHQRTHCKKKSMGNKFSAALNTTKLPSLLWPQTILLKDQHHFVHKTNDFSITATSSLDSQLQVRK